MTRRYESELTVEEIKVRMEAAAYIRARGGEAKTSCQWKGDRFRLRIPGRGMVNAALAGRVAPRAEGCEIIVRQSGRSLAWVGIVLLMLVIPSKGGPFGKSHVLLWEIAELLDGDLNRICIAVGVVLVLVAAWVAVYRLICGLDDEACEFIEANLIRRDSGIPETPKSIYKTL